MTEENALRKFRMETGKTPDEVGRLFGVDRATIYRWEQGKPRIPIKYLDKAESITGLSRRDLRPDVFCVAV